MIRNTGRIPRCGTGDRRRTARHPCSGLIPPPFPSPLLCTRFDATGCASVPSRHNKFRNHCATPAPAAYAAAATGRMTYEKAAAPPPAAPDHSRIKPATACGGRGGVPRQLSAPHDNNLLMPSCTRIASRHPPTRCSPVGAPADRVAGFSGRRLRGSHFTTPQQHCLAVTRPGSDTQEGVGHLIASTASACHVHHCPAVTAPRRGIRRPEPVTSRRRTATSTRCSGPPAGTAHSGLRQVFQAFRIDGGVHHRRQARMPGEPGVVGDQGPRELLGGGDDLQIVEQRQQP